MSGGWSWARCEETAERLLAALDWRALGALYFHDDGEARWQQLLPRVLQCGLDQARALLRRVPATGRSLYVGAGVAELPALLAERLVRGRAVVATNLRARECELLTAGLQRCGLRHELAFEAIDAAAAAPRAPYDHLGCVSVFTDPAAWPLLSAVAYGRIAPVQLDVERFAHERERARALATAVFAGLQRPGWITTSVDEVAWFLDQGQRAGVPVEPDGDTVPTAVVGDAVGFLRVG